MKKHEENLSVTLNKKSLNIFVASFVPFIFKYLYDFIVTGPATRTDGVLSNRDQLSSWQSVIILLAQI